MKTLLLIVLLLVGLPGLCKIYDPLSDYCQQLDRQAHITTNIQEQGILIGRLYSECPIPGYQAELNNNLIQLIQQGQINNLQRQQNLNTYLWLQQVNK